MISNDEYPFWARWYVNRTLEADITSVNYIIQEYDEDTDAFVTVDSGTIATRDARGRWVAPFVIPDVAENVIYHAEYTPVGGSHPVVSEEIETADGTAAASGSGGGAETYTGCVNDSNGDPIEGATIRASFYGTITTAASTTSDANGDFTLSGLVEGAAYTITANASGYKGKLADKVVI